MTSSELQRQIYTRTGASAQTFLWSLVRSADAEAAAQLTQASVNHAYHLMSTPAPPPRTLTLQVNEHAYLLGAGCPQRSSLSAAFTIFSNTPRR